MKFPFRLLACAAIVAAPVATSAQTAVYFSPPKVLVHGTGPAVPEGGNVMVQVFVKKDGSFTVNKVIKSTNPNANAAALAIAKTSKYKPAAKDGKPVDAYYDYVLSFTKAPPPVALTPTAQALAYIRDGKYDDAKSELQTYISAHADDTQAYTLLGVADTFGGDMAGAAAAFDKAGTIPDQYKPLAEQAYKRQAAALLDAKKFSDAATVAGRAIEVNPQSLEAYYIRGVAETDAQNDAAAITDLQKARAIATTAKSDTKTQVTLAYSLAVAQLDAGLYGEAGTTAKEVAAADGPRAAQLDKDAYAAVSNAAVSLANAGKTAESVSRFESGANAFPGAAAGLLAQAATVLATDKKPDWKKVEAEAERALALNPNSGRAEFILGVAAANQKDPKGAIDYLNKAKSSAEYSTDTMLATQIDAALKQLNTPAKAPL